jgi:hypothetical protein
MNLTAPSTEQLQLYLHEIEGILSLLEDILPARLPDDGREQYETILEQANVLENQLTFEIARRQLGNLQTKVRSESLLSSVASS